MLLLFIGVSTKGNPLLISSLITFALIFFPSLDFKGGLEGQIFGDSASF